MPKPGSSDRSLSTPAQRIGPFYDGPPPDDFTPDLHHGYRRELDELGEHLVHLIETLVAPGTLPALVHCAAGKDRTGVAIAMLLAAVGTRPEDCADWRAWSKSLMVTAFRLDLANGRRLVVEQRLSQTASTVRGA